MKSFASVFGPGPSAHERSIFDFAMHGGKFAALTTDLDFAHLLKQTLRHDLGLAAHYFIHVESYAAFINLLDQEPSTSFVLCMDRVLPGISCAQALEKILSITPEIKIIIVTQEVDQHTLALLVEQGTHNVITKPISPVSLTEKLAFTIAPQGKLGKLIEQGKKMIVRRDWGAALMTADEILAEKQGSAVGFMIKGDAYLGLNMVDKAADMYKRAVRSAELYLAPLKRLAEMYDQLGDHNNQLNYLHRLHEISPLNIQRVMRIGELEMVVGNFQEAEVMFERAMNQTRREAAELMSSVSAHIASACADYDPDLAAKYSKKSLDLRGEAFSRKDIATVNILGISLRKQGKWKEAIREYNRVLTVLPDHAGLLYNVALAFSEGGHAAKALEIMRRALEHDPSLPNSGKNVAYNIGMMFQKAGQNGAQFFKKAYEQDPNDQVMWEAWKRTQEPTA